MSELRKSVGFGSATAVGQMFGIAIQRFKTLGIQLPGSVQLHPGTRVLWPAIALVLVCLLAASCSSSSEAGESPGSGKGRKNPLDHLVTSMTGSFSSAAQAAEDTSFYDIRLEMVPIWPNRTDGRWIYVEQAVATYLDRPYRQRVYQVTQDPDGRFRSVVYTLAEPTRFIGVWQTPALMDSISPADLDLREGCDIVLAWNPEKGTYTGSTGDKTCQSSVRGARWAYSEVEIREDGMLTWDKGLDGEGNQIWGAEKGGYQFVKLASAKKP